MKVAFLTTDNREHHRNYDLATPYFGTAPEALLQGFAMLPHEVEVHVVSCTQKKMPAPEKIASNIWFHSLHVPKIGWLRTGYQGCMRAVRSKLREIQPDLVHGQGTERDCAMSAIFSGFPNVVTIHGNMAELARMFHARIGSFNWMAGKLEDFTLPQTAGVFCNSSYTESLVKHRAEKTWLVPNPIRSDFFSLPEPFRCNDIPVLLNIGNITPRKRQVELMGVAQKLYEKGFLFEMRFIGACGHDEYGRIFKEKIGEASKRGFATYKGIKSAEELVSCMDAADGICHFPSEEAFGLVVAEALARNLKFFGARVGGIIDITYGVTGAELFESDDFLGLTQGIRLWIESGAPRLDRGGTIMRERYHPVLIAEKHLEIYAQVLEAREKNSA